MSDSSPIGSTRRFPLATLVAKIQVGVYLVLAIVAGTLVYFANGPRPALNLVLMIVLNTVPWVAFCIFLPRGSRIAAVLFGLLCLRQLFDAFSGGNSALSAMIGYGLGILGFVGLVGVVKDFTQEAAA